MVDSKVLRLLNKSIRRQTYRSYIREVIGKQMINDVKGIEQYIRDHIELEDVPYWISVKKIVEYNHYAIESDTLMNDTIGVSSNEYAIEFQDSAKFGLHEGADHVELIDLLDEESDDISDIKIGYANKYNMILENNLPNIENIVIFKQELKKEILESLYDDTVNEDNKLHAWFYYNCISLGINPGFDIQSNQNNDAVTSLYDLLRDKLEDILT